MVLDIGANDGSFSLTASPYASSVVSIDRDDRVVDMFYLSQRGKASNILPLVLDITDPSPGRGWLNRECAPFLQRVNPDIVLCLALLHHLVISNSIPIDSVVDMLASFKAQVILEVPAMSDPMVQILLAKKAHQSDFVERYGTDDLYRAIESQFVIRQRVEIGTRTLLHLEVRGS
jgi:predicted RNA methylase